MDYHSDSGAWGGKGLSTHAGAWGGMMGPGMRGPGMTGAETGMINPADMSASVTAPGHSGSGSWICSNCANLNYPHRTFCNIRQCRKIRDEMDALAPIGIGIMNTGAAVHWPRPIEFDNPAVQLGSPDNDDRSRSTVDWSRKWEDGAMLAAYNSIGAGPPQLLSEAQEKERDRAEVCWNFLELPGSSVSERPGSVLSRSTHPGSGAFMEVPWSRSELDSGSCGCGYGSAGGAPQFLSERDRVWLREGDQNAMAALAQNEQMSGTVPPTQTETVPPTQSQFIYSDVSGGCGCGSAGGAGVLGEKKRARAYQEEVLEGLEGPVFKKIMENYKHILCLHNIIHNS